MKNSDALQVYQKECWKSYKKQVGISGNYTYLYGNPVKVHVPVYTWNKGLMIIGALRCYQNHCFLSATGI